MKIAVIDDGVNSGYYPSIGELCFDLKVNEHNKVVKRIKYDKVKSSHGTTCAAIIKKYAKTAQIGSLKIISDDTFRGKANHFAIALEWCLENQIKIIHLSIGSCQQKDVNMICDVIMKLLSHGCIIVASLANSMLYSIPACIENVFGVKTCEDLKDEQYSVNDEGLYEVPLIASSRHTLVNYRGTEDITQLCNSYAAPLITAKIYNFLEINSQLTTLEIRKALGLSRTRTYQELLAKTSFTSLDIDIPIISVIGKNPEVLHAVSTLNRLFLEGGYSCKSFYYGNKMIDRNIDWIPEDAPVAKLMAFHATIMDLSLIIIINGISQETLNCTDANIIFSPHIKRNRYREDTIIIPQNYTVGNLKAALKYIEKIGGE